MCREEVNNYSVLGKRSGEVRAKSPEKALEIDEGNNMSTPLRTTEEGTTPKQLKL